MCNILLQARLEAEKKKAEEAKAAALEAERKKAEMKAADVKRVAAADVAENQATDLQNSQSGPVSDGSDRVQSAGIFIFFFDFLRGICISIF